MKKKIISSVLTCCLMLSLLPTLTVSADAASISNSDIYSLVNVANGSIGKTAAQLGIPTSGWCGYFVGYCINNSTIASKLGPIPSDACKFALSPIYWVCNTKNAGMYYSISSIHGTRLGEISETFKSSGKMISVSSNTFTPKVGDLVEFTWKPLSIHEFSHIGVVTAVNGSNITYVDGNSGSGKGKVASHVMSKTSASIIGYIRFDQAIDDKSVVSDGTYTLAPKCAPNSRLDVANGSKEKGANIQIHQANNTEAQQFEFKYLGEGYYQITSKISGKSLDVQNGNNKAGANVWQYDPNSTDAQKWMLEKAEDNCYYIVPKLNTELRLDVYSATKDNGTNVQVWSKNQSDAQKWKLISVPTPGSLPTNLTVSTDKDSYTLGKPVLITPFADNATHYAISIWRGAFGTGDRVYVNFKTPGGISFNPTQSGTYTIRVDGKNEAGYISTEKTFTVAAATPSEPDKQKTGVLGAIGTQTTLNRQIAGR